MKQERLQNFFPQAKGTITTTPTVASQRATFPKPDLSVRIYNSSNKMAWIAIGDSNVIAETSVDMPLAAGGSILVDLLGRTSIAYMVDDVTTLSGKMHMTPGNGN